MEIQSPTFMGTLMPCLLFLCFCNGAPSGEGDKKVNSNRQYSSAEEQFIIDELRLTPGNNIQVYNPKRWVEIAESHREMRELDPSIFPERTDTALSCHFKNVMLKSKGKVPLPDDLKERISVLQKQNQGGSSNATVSLQNENTSSREVRTSHQPGIKRPINLYTLAEDLFIMNVVKNYPEKRAPIYGHEMWNRAAEVLRTKHNLNPASYPYERSGEALRKRFRRLSQKSKSRPTLSRLKQVAGTTEDENLLDVLDTENIRLRYSQAEDDLIIEELLKPTCTSTIATFLSTWKTIKAKHDREVQLNTSGFPRERTIWSLMLRLRNMMRYKHPMSRALREKFVRSSSESRDNTFGDLPFTGETSHAQASDNQQSENYESMIQELLNTPCEVDFDMALAFEDDGRVNYDSFIAELLNVPYEGDFDMSKDK